ncbi:hypothetical protein PBAL39_02945 [Pedobacter sp. BAL39]|uniref:DUF2314 domain-containing protein n=1 Tax=Pedobacter sp. BAL39 TaxID=391596 RepID=UPI000155958F|nr:DUF2314 domain-containing protein [Pedobacter sp. BAL39]EDM34819.1 hypothetical protein PBAL39_02945 [Pedobacter sp. BAL39]
MKNLFLFISCIFLFSCNPDQKVIKRAGEPDVLQIEGTDARMNGAIKKANETLSLFDAVLDSKDTLITGIALKVRFDTSNGGEHIWLTDVVKKNGHYNGVIGNSPTSTTAVKLGDTVLVPDEDISDWMYVEDGKLRGGYTIRVLRDQMSDQEKKTFDQENGLIIED